MTCTVGADRMRWSRSSGLVAALAACAALAALAGAAGCSGKGTPSGGDEGFSQSGGDEYAGGGSSGGKSTGAGGDDGTIDPSKGSGGGSGVDPEHACATSSEEATLVPINMYLAVDRSGSMDDDGKWPNAKAAFLAFFNDPAAASLRVALRFWPYGGCSDACNLGPCAQPNVQLGPLSDPNQVQALTSAFNQMYPDGNTPMWAALGGATQWAIEHQSQAEGAEKVVVVLVTDGEPTACDENIDSIASHAANAYGQAGILTFAVGIAGANEGQMNVIAQAGNTQKGFFIGAGNAQADLLAALKAIQKSTVACVFAMPESKPGSEIDPQKVNVQYTPGYGGKSLQFGQVSGKEQCGPSGGWFYDDPADPAIIELCPATCDMVQADDGAKIEIVLGCDTNPA